MPSEETHGGVSNPDSRAGNPAPTRPATSTPSRPATTPTATAPAGGQAAATGVQQMANQVQGNNGPAGIFDNPQAFLQGMTMQGRVPTMQANGQGMFVHPGDFQGDPSEFNVGTATGQTATATTPRPQNAQGYAVDTTIGDIMQNGQATAQQGTVSNQAQMTAEQIDAQGTATGVNADGTVNHTGVALNQHASQGFSSIIDTSTAAGKLLAAELGEGNYTDAKATMTGQLEILSKQFVGANGDPVIPSWAAGTARNVGRIAAFTGMTGTAGTAAMAQAIMEASLPIAQQDAAFFQTLTVKNLDNRQEATINRANVLAKMDLANLDARTAAAVQNSQAFLQMDLANLTNRQQTEMVNTQARVQSIMEDSKAINAQRMFKAESQNDFTKFYDQMAHQTSMFNSEQKNAMERFNVGEVNDGRQFNAQLENQRDQFYSEMQYNIDLSNARWRQTVRTQNTAMKFEAAQTDVKNLVGVSQEALNRLWDREDALLDYSWKTVQNEQDREIAIYTADRQMEAAKFSAKQANGAAIGGGLFSLASSLFGF